jgi:hypothetical protein
MDVFDYALNSVVFQVPPFHDTLIYMKTKWVG